jgi:hypothetical protein
MTTKPWRDVASTVPSVAIVIIVSLIVGCSAHQNLGSPVDLVSAATARLTAESSGDASGNVALATSWSTGDAATVDQLNAQALAGQRASGDTTDYAFDILGVDAYPLDGGATDFIALETIRAHSDGGIFREVELYHRQAPSAQWKATMEAWFNDNIELPHLQLTGSEAHQLTPAQEQSDGAQPSALASQYATAMNDAATTEKLGAGSFAPGVATTGMVDSETSFIDGDSGLGTASVQWAPRAGGEAVALSDGALVFTTVIETKTIVQKNVGTLQYFVTQDSKRLAWGGLLAPGNYTHLTQTLLVTIAVVVTGNGLPDVVAEQGTTTAISGDVYKPASP